MHAAIRAIGANAASITEACGKMGQSKFVYPVNFEIGGHAAQVPRLAGSADAVIMLSRATTRCNRKRAMKMVLNTVEN
jgi:hypothetical protein